MDLACDPAIDPQTCSEHSPETIRRVLWRYYAAKWASIHALQEITAAERFLVRTGQLPAVRPTSLGDAGQLADGVVRSNPRLAVTDQIDTAPTTDPAVAASRDEEVGAGLTALHELLRRGLEIRDGNPIVGECRELYELMRSVGAEPGRRVACVECGVSFEAKRTGAKRCANCRHHSGDHTPFLSIRRGPSGETISRGFMGLTYDAKCDWCGCYFTSRQPRARCGPTCDSRHEDGRAVDGETCDLPAATTDAAREHAERMLKAAASHHTELDLSYADVRAMVAEHRADRDRDAA